MYFPAKVAGPVWTKSASSTFCVTGSASAMVKRSSSSLYLASFVLFQQYLGQLVLQRGVVSLKQLVQLPRVLEFKLVVAHIFRHQGAIHQIGRALVMLFHHCLGFPGSHEGNEQFRRVGMG